MGVHNTKATRLPGCDWHPIIIFFDTNSPFTLPAGNEKKMRSKKSNLLSVTGYPISHV